MIELIGVHKAYYLNGRRTVVANGINMTLPSGKAVGILGRNGAGKSSLLQIISGAIQPDRGEVRVTGTMSWPVGFAGSFHAQLTGLQNVRFIGRVYGVDTDELVAFVKDFAEIGQHFNQPVQSYSSGMKARLAFGLSMGIPFDTYLLDETTAVGDAAFKAKSQRVLSARLQHAGAIFVSHSMKQVREICDHVAVINRGKLHWFDEVQEGIFFHKALMQVSSGAGARD